MKIKTQMPFIQATANGWFVKFIVILSVKSVFSEDYSTCSFPFFQAKEDEDKKFLFGTFARS